MRLIHLPMVSMLNNHLIDYPTPMNMNYFWGFGSLAGFCLLLQMITGICLAMQYTPHMDLAFSSLERLMRDVNYGWLLRYLHANGASMFFIMVYLHMGSGLYFASYIYPSSVLWYSGILIFLLMMATAFIGYVLPWGQMSFWGATVITNLVSAVPYVGKSLTIWIWGGFSVDNSTLTRFFSLHYLLPFFIVGLILLHLVLLHMPGSNSPLGICTKVDKVNFYPFFCIKDMIGFFLLVCLISLCVYFMPNYLAHYDNYMKADSLVTPTHIVPEWYFLPFYAILRSMPNKLGGVMLMLGSILVLFCLPFLYPTSCRNPQVKPWFVWVFWASMSNFMLLGWLGSQVVEEPFTSLAYLSASFYFVYFFIILPALCLFENITFASENDDPTVK